MIITVKTLQQQTFKIEIESSETVKALKQKIEDVKGKDAYPIEGQKLIYAGKMLDDSKPLSEYNIEEKNFIVAMVSKIKPAVSPASEQKPSGTTTDAQPFDEAKSTETPTTAESKPKEEDKPPEQTESSSSATPATSTATPTTAAEHASGTTDFASMAASTLLTGQQYEENVKNIVEMGFPRNDVIAALSASFNNPDRAVEYLTTGFPENVRAPVPAAGGETGPTAVAGAPTTEQSATSETPAAGGENAFEYLRNQPGFKQMCQVLRQNPDYLPSLMQELHDTNPQLLDQISRNQAAFIDLINETVTSQQSTTPQAGGGATPQAGVAGGTTAQPPQPPPGTQHIQVSAEDKAAVDRLKALGFSEVEVLQVYMACDKNENLAANLLLKDRDSD